MAITKIQSESLNLADDFAFTGTITGAGESNVPAFEAYTDGVQNVTDSAYTKLTFATEIFDTNSCYDNSTNYRFTPTVAGKYFCYAKAKTDPTNFGNERYSDLRFHKNGSALGYTMVPVMTGSNSSSEGSTSTSHTISHVIEFNGSSDYLEVFLYFETWGNGSPVCTTRSFGAYLLTT